MWLWLVVCLCACASSAPVVHIAHGSLRGVTLNTRGGRQFHAFLGVPYAKPPVGPLRFQKPALADSWEGERDVSSYCQPCLQSNHTARGEVFGSEDCLCLNVFTHKTSNESLVPVLIYIHGGNFKEGSSEHYKPHYLMDKEIVLVTLNYRLGVFGFLSREDKELPGNNGLKDQKLALEWVRDNIAQFGGDPSAVTLCGEGSGAASVHLHMLSPLSQGLFHRAISQSGTAYCPWAIHPVGQARMMGDRFAAQLGCNHHNTNHTLDCLQAIPAYILMDIAKDMYEWDSDPVVLFGPTMEPTDTKEPFLSKDPWQLSSEKPWIVGITSSVGSPKAMSFNGSTKLIELNEDFEFHGPLTLLFRETAEDTVHTSLTIKKFYFLDGDIKPDNIEGLEKMYADAWFLYPIKEALRRHQGPRYFYFFDDKSLVPNSQVLEQHEELQYLFPMKQNTDMSEEDKKTSEKLVEMWTNFVIHGKPTLHTSEVTWNESLTASEYLHIKNRGFTMEKDLHQERDNFWSGLPYRNKFVFEHTNKEKDEL